MTSLYPTVEIFDTFSFLENASQKFAIVQNIFLLSFADT